MAASPVPRSSPRRSHTPICRASAPRSGPSTPSKVPGTENPWPRPRRSAEVKFCCLERPAGRYNSEPDRHRDSRKLHDDARSKTPINELDGAKPRGRAQAGPGGANPPQERRLLLNSLLSYEKAAAQGDDRGENSPIIKVRRRSVAWQPYAPVRCVASCACAAKEKR